MSDSPIGHLPLTQLQPGSPQQPSDALAAGTEQDLVRELHAALRLLVEFYGTQNAAARALGVSSAMLTRTSPAWLATYAASDRLPRPHISTLQKLISCEHECVRQIAAALLARRSY